jgi:hypothetical protein
MRENGFTLKFEDNHNKKLYSKFFLVIRSLNHFAEVGKLVEIELKGKVIMSAKIVSCEIVKFSEIPQALIQIESGLNHADSLTFYAKQGIEINKFDTKIKLMLVESLSYK